MIAASVKDGEAVVDILLQRGADVNQKSIYIPELTYSFISIFFIIPPHA
jgi:hypothetical protein